MRLKRLNYIPFLLLLLCISFEDIHAQFITIKQGTSVQVDGVVDEIEWADADSIQIDLNSTLKVTVKFKHDGTNFNFVFLNNLESFNIRFPEILIDVENDKSNFWMSDDWWFHVSATDCESNTAANDYSNCLLVQPDWIAMNNFVSGPPMTDTVEIQIPFAKLNFTSSVTDTIGLAFDVTNTFSIWNFWPDPLVDVQVPASWGNAIVEFNTTAIPAINKALFEIVAMPNPVKSELQLSIKGFVPEEFAITIRDLRGQIVETINYINSDSRETLSIPFSSFLPGLYFLVCMNGENVENIKIVKL